MTDPSTDPMRVPAERTTGSDRTIDLIVSVLAVGTVASVLVVSLASLLNLAAGRVPFRDRGPSLAPDRFLGDLAALRPEGLLWLGLLLVVALPTARVILAFAGYLRAGDRRAAGVAGGVLAVLALSVAVALAAR